MLEAIDQLLVSEPDLQEYVALNKHMVHHGAIKMLIQRRGGAGALRYTTLGRLRLCVLIL